MESFAVAAVPAPGSFLQRYVRIDTLPRLCASIERVLWRRGERGEIWCVWGQFRVHREALPDGVRFTLPNCTNALQWTVTAAHDGGARRVLVHCSVNQQRPEPDFGASIEQFVQDWRQGLERELEHLRAEGAPRPGAKSMPWFG